MTKFIGYEGCDEANHRGIRIAVVREGLSGTVPWVMLEQPKGPPFSIWLTRKGVLFAKHSEFLTENTMYHSWQSIKRRSWMKDLTEYHMKHRHLMGDTDAVSIHGVLCGTGTIRHPEYCPVGNFVALDVRGSDKKYIDYPKMVEFCSQFNIPLPPEIKQGKFPRMMRDLMNGISPFKSKIPVQTFGVSDKDGENTAYGVSIRPVENLISNTFNRRPTILSVIGKSYVKEDDEVKDHPREFLQYINIARMCTVHKKYPRLNRGDLIGKLFSSALNDYNHMNDCDLREIVTERRFGAFQSEAMAKCKQVIENYLH